MSALSGKIGSPPVANYIQEEEQKTQDNKPHNMLSRVVSKMDRKATFHALMGSMPYTMLATYLGADNSDKIRKIIPRTMQDAFFRKCLKVGFDTVQSNCLYEEDILSLQGMDAFMYMLGSLSKACRGEAYDTNPVFSNYQVVKQDNQLRIQNNFHLVLQEMMNWISDEFKKVGVNSFQEFEKKLLSISDVKDLAEQQYMSIKGNLERRKTIDRAIFVDEKMDSDDLAIFEQFWNDSLSHAQGGMVFQSLEKQLKTLLFKASEAFIVTCRKLEYRATESLNQLYLEVCFSATSLSLDATPDFSEFDICDKAIAQNYFYMKATAALGILARRELRLVLERRYETCKNNIEEVMTEVRLVARHNLTLQERQIVMIEALTNNKECEDPEFPRMKAHWESLPENERKIQSVKQDGTLTEGLDWMLEAKKHNEMLLALGDEEFTNLMPEFAGEKRNIEALLEKCKETPADRLFIDSYTILWGNNVLKSETRHNVATDIDMKCDFFQLRNPLQYFVELIQQRDDERLSLIGQ